MAGWRGRHLHRDHQRDVHRGEGLHSTEGHVKGRKRGHDGSGLPVAKRTKPYPLLLHGHSNLTERHLHQFCSLVALVSGKQKRTVFPFDRDSILKDDTSSGMCMEWCDEREANFVWLSSGSKRLSIKLELLAAFKCDLLNKEEKRPLLAFSQSFDEGVNWAETKLLLKEIFGHSTAAENPNYLYAFTRVGDKFHLQIFEILQRPTADNSALQLKKRWPAFVFRPESIQSSNESVPFIEESFLCIEDQIGEFDSLQFKNTHIVEHLYKEVFLPLPPNTIEWEGFNTTPSEFFQRYLAFKKTKIIGTGPPLHYPGKVVPTVSPVEYYHICMPFKVFARSLFLQAEELFQKKLCFEEINVNNIFFRGKKPKILGVKTINYCSLKAASNVKQIGLVVHEVIKALGLPEKDYPKDLSRVLFGILKVDKSDDDEAFDLKNFDLVLNNSCWMSSIDKIHMFDDLYDEFRYKMTPYEQMRVGVRFPKFKQQQKRLARNWLMEEVSNYRMPPDDAARKAKHKKWERDLLDLTNFNLAAAKKLYAVRRAARTPRNAFHHFTEIAAPAYGDVEREVEVVVASEFCDVCIGMQEGVTSTFRSRGCNKTELDFARTSFKRFEKYFQSTDKIQFKEMDRK